MSAVSEAAATGGVGQATGRPPTGDREACFQVPILFFFKFSVEGNLPVGGSANSSFGSSRPGPEGSTLTRATGATIQLHDDPGLA